MKYILYLLFITQIAQAQQSRFKEGETIYVWALSGLNMRKLPDAKSEKIAALPYGTKVTVKPNEGIIVPYEVEEFKDFSVKGVWLLVQYGDKKGFVFDGFMSRLIAPEKEIFLNQFKKQGKSTEYINHENRRINVQQFNKGLVIEEFVGEQFGNTYYKIEDISLFEGYVILRKLQANLFTKPDILKYKNKEISVEKYFEEGGSAWGNVKLEKKGEVVILMGGGC